MTRVLITGGAGFIGAHLARLFVDDGAWVDLIDDFSRGARDADLQTLLSRREVRCIERDLLASRALADLDERYDVIFHFAAIVGVANVIGQPQAVLRNNVGMLCNVLAFAARQQALKRFVFASTSEVYDASLSAIGARIPTPEDIPLVVPDLSQPRSSYALSKIYGEALCRQSGLPVTILRPHNIYGPRMGMSHVIPELLARILGAPEGAHIAIHSIRHRRAFCYVRDAVEMIKRLALAEDAQGEALNIGNPAEEVSIGELARLVAEIVGREVVFEEGPETSGSPRRRAPDIGKAARLASYVPSVSLPTGIRETFQWYLVNLFATDGQYPSSRARMAPAPL